MKKKLLNKNAYEAICRNCKHGRLSPEGDTVLCMKKGIVDPDDTCRRYSYDPLKRVPRKMPAVREANPEDFDLNAGFEAVKETPSETVIAPAVKEIEPQDKSEEMPVVSVEVSEQELLKATEIPAADVRDDDDFAMDIDAEDFVDDDDEDDGIYFDDDDEFFGEEDAFDEEEDEFDEDLFEEYEEDFFDDEEDEFGEDEILFDDEDDVIFDDEDDEEEEEFLFADVIAEEDDDPASDWSKTSIFDDEETEKE